MGCGTEIACITCKKTYWCGYGSYSRFRERQAKFPFHEHQGHDLRSFSEDWTSEYPAPHLWGFGGYEPDYILVPDYQSYEQLSYEDSGKWYQYYKNDKELTPSDLLNGIEWKDILVITRDYS